MNKHLGSRFDDYLDNFYNQMVADSCTLDVIKENLNRDEHFTLLNYVEILQLYYLDELTEC